jgi:hypothetical protein
MTYARRAKTRQRALAAAAAALLAASAFTAGVPANAVDGGGIDRTIDPAVLMLANERAISVPEAQRRMGWQQKASDVQDAMALAPAVMAGHPRYPAVNQ